MADFIEPAPVEVEVNLEAPVEETTFMLGGEEDNTAQAVQTVEEAPQGTEEAVQAEEAAPQSTEEEAVQNEGAAPAEAEQETVTEATAEGVGGTVEADSGLSLLAEGEEMPAPAAEAEAMPEEDRTALMADLINTAVEARREEGINAALDNSFATLAENATLLANPETGVMKENLTGSESPFKLSTKYFNQYRRTFVNKSNTTKIKLSPNIRVECDLGESIRVKAHYRDIPKTSPDYMTKNPLSADQVKSLASYCAQKKTTLFEFLFNKMQFYPYVYSDTGLRLCAFHCDYNRSDATNRYLLPDSGLMIKNRVFLATGAQTHKRNSATIQYKGELIGGYMQAVNMLKVGAASEQIKFFDNKSTDNNYRATVAFFEKY